MNRHRTAMPPFSENPDFDFEIRTAVGAAVEGASDPGEVLAAVADVGASDHEAWYSAWFDLGERVAAIADAAAAGGHRVSAASAYLRASSYFSVAVNAVSSLDSDSRLASTFGRQQAAWRGFVASSPVPVAEVAIPYEDSTLPGWLFRPAGDASSRPTVVAVNGSDGPLAGIWATCAAPALRRGCNVLAFDGPGQQSQLFEQGVLFRPDWEHVLTPVYDFLVGRDGVDPDRIAVYGISQGGYWVARAIAFEHRFAAAITDPGVVDVSTSWTRHIPDVLLKALDAGKVDRFDREMALGMKLSPATDRTWRFRARPYGTTGYGETLEEVRRYTAVDVASQITTPLLILSPEGEQFWPGQAEQLAELTGDVSTLIRFTAEEGADGHCQPLARGLTAQRMFDWLDGVLAPGRTTT